ncbi:MAG: acyl-CoA dehydrogenase family protein [Anaeromyxobacteraceae bacterium]
MYLELDTTLTDQHQAIRTLVRDLARKVIRPAARALDAVPASDVPTHPAYLGAMKATYEAGLHGILLPEAFGGMGLDPASIHIALEELGAGSGALAVSIGVSSFPAFGCTLLASESEALVNEFVIPFTSDREASVIGCWGITEPDHGTDWLLGPELEVATQLTPSLTARREGDGWVLNGQKAAWVSNGPIATHCFLFVGVEKAQGMRGAGVALVDLRSPGVSRGKPWDKHGQRALPQGEIYFDDVRIPARQMLVQDPETYAFALDATLAMANSAMGAIFTGVARAAYEEAFRYAGVRVQGGAPIRRHQAVQLTLSRMWQRVEIARAISRRALAFNYSTLTPSLKHAVASKVYCTEAAFQNAHEAIQVCGGMGLGRESDVEMLFRDARSALVEDGVNEALSLDVGRKLDAKGEG